MIYILLNNKSNYPKTYPGGDSIMMVIILIYSMFAP